MNAIQSSYGASLVREGCRRLSEGEEGGSGGGQRFHQDRSVVGTACQIFHSFFTKVPANQFDILLTAAASCLLASKTHDSPSFVRSVVIVFDRIQQERQHPLWSCPMYLLGSRHQTWCAALRQMESIILKELSFSLYPFLEHPHRYVPFIATALSLDPTQDKLLLQDVWNFLNDCIFTTICIEFPPQVVAVAAFVRAAATHSKCLPKEFAATYGASDYPLVLQAMIVFYTDTLPNTPSYMDSVAPKGWRVPLLPPKLTFNAIANVHNNSKSKTPVTLQILSLKTLPKERYKCNVSDGVSTMNAVFTKKLKLEHNMEENSLIVVTEQELKEIGTRKVMIILNCKLLAQTSAKIKNPTRYESNQKQTDDNKKRTRFSSAMQPRQVGKRQKIS